MTRKQKPNWSNISEKLRGLSERDLKFIIKELYALNDATQDYLNAKFLDNEDLLPGLKEKIEKFLTPHSYEWKGPELAKAKKVIQSFKKATNNVIGTLKLMLYYYELLTEYQHSYGPNIYVDSPANSVFKDILVLMNSQNPESIKDLLKVLIIIRKRWEYADDYDVIFKTYAPNLTGLIQA